MFKMVNEDSCEGCYSYLLPFTKIPASRLDSIDQAKSREDYWKLPKTTVKERVWFLFNNEVMSDVHFLVENGDSSKRIPAHKMILSLGSPVFDAMFNGGMCSKDEEIHIPDIESEAFLALLEFLYSDDVHIEPDSVMAILYTAKKYAVPALEQLCDQFLESNLAPDNAFLLLTQARLFEKKQLVDMCLEVIDRNTKEALVSDQFTEIDHDTLCYVLERDSLRVGEMELFEAAVKWAKAKCENENIELNHSNLRKILGRALSLIRFPLMTEEEFSQGPARSNILTYREIAQLYLYFTICAHNDTFFTSEASTHTFRVMFKEPVEILPNTDYSAKTFFELDCCCYCGTLAKKKMTIDCPSCEGVTFHFKDDEEEDGNNYSTSIPEIIFYT